MLHEDPVSFSSVAARMVASAAGQVFETEQAALTDEPDGVHAHRTRVRRMRSILAVLRPHLDSGTARRLRVELREWGRQLGTVRDAEVAAADAEAAMAEAGIDDEAMRRRLIDAPTADYASLHARLVRLRDEPRAEARMRELRAFAADPRPIDPDTDGPLADLLRGEVRRVKKAAKRTDGTLDGYHDLRKAGRRLRYVAEAIAAAGALEDVATPLGKAGAHLHDVFGAHRDAVALADRLERARGRASRAGEPTEGYDRLIAAANEKAAQRHSRFDDALARVRAASGPLSS